MVKRWNGADHLPAIGNRYNTILGFNEPYNHNEDPETIAYAWLKVIWLFDTLKFYDQDHLYNFDMHMHFKSDLNEYR